MEILRNIKSVTIQASIESVWSILTRSEFTKEYMFNCSVTTDWIKGSEIIWSGTYQGYDAYQKGQILDVVPFSLIKYSTFDPNFGLADIPENYIHVTYELQEQGEETLLSVTNETFDGNKERMKHIDAGWEMVIPKMKSIAEGE